MSREEWLTIKENETITDHIYRMELESHQISQEAQAGQFIHLLCGGEYGALLRRPFSLSYINREKQELTIIYRVQGKGTKNLSQMKKGDKIHALGPLGKGFTLEPSLEDIAVVAGGMGAAPLLEVVRSYKNPSRVYLGFLDQPILEDEYRKCGSQIKVYTETGNAGEKGLVTQGLLEEWKKNPPGMVYTCGPKPMMGAVVRICEQLNIPCQVSMEERMGCGIGACLVCNCRTKREGQKNTYTRVCKEGPVYWGREVLWDE